VPLSRQPHHIRIATDEDREVIGRIAALDSSRAIEGPALIGEIDGVPVAVLSLSDGRVVANPFRLTAELVSLMRAQAKAMGAPGRVRRRRTALSIRRAPRTQLSH
jgi:hypothetical protein